MSQCGLFYKIIVTCLAVGVSLASQDDMSAYNDYPYLLQVAPSEGVLARLVGDALALGSAGSASYYEDGAEPRGSIVTGEYRRQRVRGVDNADPLHTAAQSYYIEPEVPTTTTKRPMFKKRKTKRPITVLALKKKPQALEGENHNEPPQGNPAVVFNPLRQLVPTGFRKRPSSDKPDQLDRPKIRVRAKPRTTEKPVEEKEIVNEVPVSTTEGEPRALGRRKPPQEVRPINQDRPLPESENFNVEEPEIGRFPPPPPQELIKPATITNNNVRPSPRNFGSRPRPTTTISSSDEPGNTQPQPLPRRKALRPLAASRFSNNANANRPAPSDAGSEDGPVSPVRLPRRRPLRPTTTQETTTIPTLPPTTTVAPAIIPDDINNGIVVLPPFSAVRKDPSTTTPPRQVQTRPGFTLRPRPATTAEPTRYSRGRTTPADEDVATPPPVNKRRKRPQSGRTASGFQTETITEGVAPARQSQGVSPPRRVRPITRSRPVPSTGTVLPPFPGSRAAQRTPVEEPKAPATENEAEEEETDEEKPEATPAPVRGSPPRHYSGFHSSPLGSNFGLGSLDTSFPTGGLFSPDSLTQNPTIHNVLGSQSSANFRPFHNQPFQNQPFQNQPFFNQFSSRTTQSYDTPHISDLDFQLAASTEKEAIAEAPADIKAQNAEKVAEPASSPVTRKPSGTYAKISAFEKLQNRQAAARRFLTPRKPTEKTTEVPTVVNMKSVNNFRKSIVPPRMLRSRGKSQAESSPQNAEERMDTGPIEMEDDIKPEGMGEMVKESGIINETAASASSDTETNVVPISPKAVEEEGESASRKPSILENAKRRRMPFPSRNWMNSDNMKITPAPASEQNADTPPPTCEDGRRYSKFLKRCVTMYKPKIVSQG